ncbi:hypothetical protein NP493_850g00010, partial [Ridgeia piscesae]
MEANQFIHSPHWCHICPGNHRPPSPEASALM